MEYEHIERIVTFEEITAFDDSSQQTIHDEPVSEDEDPFEQPEIEVQPPEIHIETPSRPEEQPEPLQETPEIAPVPEAAREVATDSVDYAPETAPSDDTNAQNAQGNAESSVTEPHLGNAIQGNVEKPATASIHTGTNASASHSQTDETELWKAYTQTLSNHFKQHKHYPEMAKKLHLTGTVWLLVEISRTGEILSAEIAQSSGVEILDEAALSSAQKAGPVPGFPQQTSAETKKLRIPYHYRLK